MAAIEGKSGRPLRLRPVFLLALALILYSLLHTTPPFGVRAQDDFLTEAELRVFDGTNDDKTIYVAIDGIIFDVSASPNFYGPGGHYHHFAGRDGSRAWVTECWDSEDQLTWRMDGVEDMFMPKWLDEMIEGTADGSGSGPEEELMGRDQMAKMAKTVMKKLGKITERQKEDRRKEDAQEAKEGLDRQLAHWVDFFRANDKYKVVGYVVHDKDKPEPPAICEEAMKKRPVKYGKLEGVMSLGNNPNNRKKEPEIPDFIKAKLKDSGATGGEEPAAEEKDEL